MDSTMEQPAAGAETAPPPPPAPAAIDTPPNADSLQAVMNVPVKLRAVLGRSRMELHRLLRLRPGDVLPLDRRAGEPVDLFVNNRLVARGEVVLVDNALGVTLTEIVRQDG
ncbi:flagellar motor switch protein FliN [Sphingomonas sp. RHCKR7]|uniref:flagellar motor switch protein FliN n=1 Tax=Sphingomonas folli TaxID=2862497 RepID=UPI001CA4AC2B|nr:flagellar motor switch protein FliN [Sphingomonas folli]MBW6525529.1 flagellar motor switch protein FliN [Sphingomonas folli]